jgi:hypothetical protein
MRLTNYLSIDDVIKDINYISDLDRYQQMQIITIDETSNIQFMEYLNSISEFTYIDAIGGKSSPQSFRRYNINNEVSFKEVIHMAPTGIKCGIKIVKYPLSKLTNWDKWEGGYIEGFIRMDSDDNRWNEIFIWEYIKMDKLKGILTKFQSELEIL